MGAEKNNGVDRGKEKSGISKKLYSMTYVRSLTRQEVMAYIGRLHKNLKKHEKKLKKYKTKLKALKAKGSENKCNNVPKDADVKSVGKDTPKEPLSFIDEIREAAENAQNQNGFIYEPTSGLYYDQKTGYYYNAEYGLYYDGNNGCYYQYDQEKNEFRFHSQVQVQRSEADKAEKRANDDNDEENSGGSKHRAFKKKKKIRRDSDAHSDEEDGEILSSSDAESNSDVKTVCYDSDSKYEDIAKRYPPSLRMIVQETNTSKLKVGTLYMITYKGGSLGREGDHDVLIPDLNVSKYHLKFSYNEEKAIYECVDLGSRNGTLLNGKRMSTAKQESEPLNIVHGSILQVSQTKLLCHIHNGNSTCGHCEPGLLVEQADAQRKVARTHKEQLKTLQKRYGLENEKYVDSKVDSQYNDRAAVRRDKIGSSNDYEKTQVASTESEIPSDNKGFKLLSKLGWNKGEKLGKGSDGLLEPIPLVSNEGTKGLGCTERSVSVNLSKTYLKKNAKWKKTQERYKELSKLDIFCDNEDSD